MAFGVDGTDQICCNDICLYLLSSSLYTILLVRDQTGVTMANYTAGQMCLYTGITLAVHGIAIPEQNIVLMSSRGNSLKDF